MTEVLIYLAIGWALALYGWLSVGQYRPENPDLPKWRTVLVIWILWPVLIGIVVWTAVRQRK